VRKTDNCRNWKRVPASYEIALDGHRYRVDLARFKGRKTCGCDCKDDPAKRMGSRPASVSPQSQVHQSVHRWLQAASHSVSRLRHSSRVI
jgi:hypothetical protein